MAETAAAWLDALDAAQRSKAAAPFESEGERTDWAYFPRQHAGLPLLEQDARQQKLAHALVAGALSLPAYARVASIMALESVLNEIEGRRADAVRDPGRYFLKVYGAPGAGPWAWRIEGHHVFVSYTLVDDAVFATPIFLGANPAEVRHGDTPVVRPCAEEEDCARELLASLDADRRAVAVVSAVAPPDFVLTNAARVPERSLPGEAAPLPIFRTQFDAIPPAGRDGLAFDRARPKGLPASQMDAAQRRLLSQLVDVYVERLPEPLAQIERARIDLESVHFAWAGEDRPRRPHYYRLQGGSFLVEYDNTQDGANLVHAGWRNPDRDFAYDALAAHTRAAH